MRLVAVVRDISLYYLAYRGAFANSAKAARRLQVSNLLSSRRRVPGTLTRGRPLRRSITVRSTACRINRPEAHEFIESWPYVAEDMPILSERLLRISGGEARLDYTADMSQSFVVPRTNPLSTRSRSGNSNVAGMVTRCDWPPRSGI